MTSEDQSQFCLSHLEDDLHSSLDSLFIKNAGTNDLFQQLDAYCEATTTASEYKAKPIIVVGESGCGKSTALANWTARRKANAVPSHRLDYTELTFWHTIGCSWLSTSVTHLLRRLVNELIAHFNLKDDMDLADEKLSWVLPRLLERAAKRGCVVIVIDGGLQHICSQDKDLGLRWLPLSLPQNVKMILSATKPTDDPSINTQGGSTDYAKRRLVKVQQTWDEIQRRKWPTLQLQPLQTSSVGSFIEDFLASSEYQHVELAVSERKQIIDMISTHSCATNPLFITLMLRGLCHALSFGYNINQCLVLMLPCRNAEELTDKMLMLFDSGMPRKSSLGTANPNRLGLLLGDSLCLLFVARHGLREDELFDLLWHVRKQSLWNKKTEDTVLPVKLKIVSMLMQKKNRLIDIFRSFDKDGNGTLSHEEFYSGMERLDIGVTHEEVQRLINEVDSNGDGEIDYQETLDHFETIARAYSHGKRRVSVVGYNAAAAGETLSLQCSITDESKNTLIGTLRCLGVGHLDTDAGSVLTLPFNNSVLRDVIWNKCINAAAKMNNEAKHRNFLIEYFSGEQPSLRFCEELPWHLKKVNSWNGLKKVLTDLRTLDIMYGSLELKAELFSYLSTLLSIGGAIRFDIVREYNQSIEKWVVMANPSASQVYQMSFFLTEVMAWFSRKISGHTQLPPFLREKVDESVLGGADLVFNINRERVAPNSFRKSSEIQSEAHQYYFNRWIWIQFPWLSLQNACLVSQNDQKQTPNQSKMYRASTTSEDPSIGLREKSLIKTIAEPSATLMKLNKMSSTSPKKKTITEIPFSSQTTWQNTQEKTKSAKDNPSNEDLMKQLRDLKHIHDTLAVEASNKETQLLELERANKARQVVDKKSHKRIVQGEKELRELHSRLQQLHGLSDIALSVDMVYNNILLALHINDPTTQNKVLQLEEQILLATEQIHDLKKERELMMNDIEKIDAKSKKLSEEVNAVAHERQKIQPTLEALKAKISEEAERRKHMRAESFDAAAFSRRVRLEGKIAKRRATKMMRAQPIGACTTAEITAAKRHPLERLAQIAGTQDPTSIADKMKEDETKRLFLLQEQCEHEVKRQSASLEQLQCQIKHQSLADSGAGIRSTGEEVANKEALILKKQNQLDSVSELLLNVSLAIINLSGLVQPAERERRLSEFAQITQKAAHSIVRLDNTTRTKDGLNVKRLAQLIKSLHDEIPEDMTTFANNQPTSNKREQYQNVRILNRDALESSFSSATNQLHETEDNDGDVDSVQDAEEDFDKLSSYVSDSLLMGSSKNQQRRANYLTSNAKQGKYASKGVILESVLHTASTNMSPE